MEKPIYSLQLIDYWCNTALQTQKELIRIAELTQSFHGLAVSLFSAYGVYQQWVYHDSCILLHNSNVVLWQLVFDFFFINRFEMLLHHILSIGIIGFYQYYLTHLPLIYISALASTEISTIFLILDKALPKYSINKILFVASFFYFRIYLFSKYLLLDSFFHESIHLYSIGATAVFYFCLTGLFSLNVYWAIAILKKIYATAKHEYWMQYAYFVSPCVSWYIYRPYVNPYVKWNTIGWIETCIWLDLLGQILLALCSYQLYRQIIQETNPNKYFQLNEIAAKHVRSFLFVLAKYISIQQHGNYSPNIFGFYCLYFIHAGAMAYTISHVVQSKTVDASFQMNQKVFLLDIGYVAIYTADFALAMIQLGIICLQLGFQWDPDFIYILTTLPLALSLAERF
jgi:hypothetical protein